MRKYQTRADCNQTLVAETEALRGLESEAEQTMPVFAHNSSIESMDEVTHQSDLVPSPTTSTWVSVMKCNAFYIIKAGMG